MMNTEKYIKRKCKLESKIEKESENKNQIINKKYNNYIRKLSKYYS